MRLNGGCVTDRGNIRAVNQDAIFFRSVRKGNQYFALGVVCDGIGGLVRSELASGQVIGAVTKWFEEVAGWIDIRKAEPEILFSHLKDGAETWNRQVRELIRQNHFMTGTTMSALMIVRDRYYIVHVGDSRVYLYRHALYQLTGDETVARIRAGRIKYCLTNYLGKDDMLRFTADEGSVREGDLFLYGSDGFFHCLMPEDIEAIYGNHLLKKDMRTVCGHLIETVKSRGERDNISAGIIMTGKGRTLLPLRKK